MRPGVPIYREPRCCIPLEEGGWVSLLACGVDLLSRTCGRRRSGSVKGPRGKVPRRQRSRRQKGLSLAGKNTHGTCESEAPNPAGLLGRPW